MSDKQLTEAAWKAFAKGKPPYKDAALLKALAAVDKAEKAGPQAQLDALDEVDKQADALRKLHKADKDLGGYLDDIGKSAAKERKAAETALAKAEASTGDDEEESPALLTSKMIPLLRQVKKGDVVMQVLIATTGKDTALLLSRKSISPVRGKLLKEYLGVSGAIKFIRGECLLEENAHTFVLQSQAAGMAKKLKAALLAQTEMRLKVRVRGEDPNDLDEEAEDGDGGNDGKADASTGDRTTDQTAEQTATPEQTSSIPPPPPSPAAAYEARLAGLQPRVDAALARPGPHVAKLQALLDFARGKAGTNDHLAALQGLATLARQLDALPTTQPTGTPPEDDPSPAFNARLAALLPRIKPAIAADAAVGDAARLKLSEAGVFARKKDFAQANALLDEADELLKSATATPSGDATPVDAGKAYTARLAAMQKAIQAALAGPLAAQLKPLVAALAAAGRDPAAGGQALDAIEALLTRDVPDAPPPSDGGDEMAPPDAGGEQAAEYARLLATVEGRYTQVLAGNPADATRLRAQMAYAVEQAELGEHGAALAGLRRLEGLLDAAEQVGSGAGVGYEGLVAYRKTLLDFGKAASSVESQIAGFKAAIPGQLPGETGLADDLIAALTDYNQDLKDAVDDAMNAAENEASPVTGALVDLLKKYRLDVSSNPLIKHVDNNPFGVPTSVGQTLVDALTDILDAMPAAR